MTASPRGSCDSSIRDDRAARSVRRPSTSAPGPTARDRGVQIKVRPLSTTVLVHAVEADLQNLLINLLLNAVQASKAGSEVTVSVQQSDKIRISITDQGCGIAPEFQQKIFEPFFSMRDGGTGLGLFLSVTAVRRWGGDILVESTPGKGSTFELLLPYIAVSHSQETVR